jgi:hypothetical protein
VDPGDVVERSPSAPAKKAVDKNAEDPAAVKK